MKLNVDVALLPAQRHEFLKRVCVVVDILRATSSIVALLDAGAREVVPAASVAQARSLHDLLPDYLLCGEEGGMPPAGFDYGNSPAEFSRLELAGRGVILATSNGTRVLNQVKDAPFVLAGALLNRTAAAKAAARLAKDSGLGVTIICAGAYNGAVFALEDAIGAGSIVSALLLADPADLGDGARAALSIYEQALSSLTAAISSTQHAADLKALGLEDDLTYCAQADTTSLVPRLSKTTEGLLVLRALGS